MDLALPRHRRCALMSPCHLAEQCLEHREQLETDYSQSDIETLRVRIQDLSRDDLGHPALVS